MQMKIVRTAAAMWAMIFLWATGALAQEPTENFFGREVTPREVLIGFRNFDQQSLNRIARTEDLDRAEAVGRAGAILLRSRSKDVPALVQSLLQDPDVAFVEPNYIVRKNLVPNDTSFGQLWGLNNTGQSINGVTGVADADIDAVEAWNVTTGSRSIVVGVVDTGIDYNHPDLAANVWSAPSAFSVTIRGVVINCAAGTHGFNAILRNCAPLDDEDHGSHVAGTIGGVGNNARGVAGVNWVTSMMGLKFLDNTGSGSTANAIDAIDFAIQAKAIFGSAANVRVLNNSWGGGGFSTALFNEITLANSNDILFVAAAGNSGSNNDASPHYPSNYNVPNIMSVAATTNRDLKAGFSSYGATTVHLGAPGQSILSTIRGSQYAYFNGTSMATPHVAGAAALILSVCNLNTAALKSLILTNTDPISALAGITTTGGRLNVNRALSSCTGTPDFTLSATPGTQTISPGGNTSFTISSAPVGGFNGNVGLTVTGLPNGATGTFTVDPIVGGSGSSTLSITTTGGVATGSYPLTITGTSGALTRTTAATLVISSGTSGFTVSATPGSNSTNPGGRVTYNVTVSATGGFAGTVTLSALGVPNASEASFSPRTVTGSGASVLTIVTSNSTTPGTYNISVRGTSGTTTQSTMVTLVVNGTNPDFTIGATPPALSIVAGSPGTFTTTVGAVNGFTGSVTLSVSGLPAGATGSFTPSSIVTSGSSSLAITTSASVTPGSYTLTITGTSGSLVHSTTVSLTVTAPGGNPDFALSANPTSITVPRGSVGNVVITVSSTGGFSGTVSFTITGKPAKTEAQFVPATVTTAGTTTLKLFPGLGAAPGTYNMTVVGTGSGLTRQTALTLIVQ